MRVALLCATRRGRRFLKKLTELLPQGNLVVFSFREEPWEPPFLDDIRELTLTAGGQFFEATQVGAPRLKAFWESTPIDIMFVVSWRYMIPRHVYVRPRSGTFVFHDAYLPEYRGFAPTVWSIINGEPHTGVTLFAINDEVDAGDIIDQKRIPIGPDDTISELLERVTETYLEILEGNLQPLLNGTAPRYAQDPKGATFTCKRVPKDNQIDWAWSTDRIYNLIRATSSPYPGAYTYLAGKKLFVWAATRRKEDRRYVGRIPGRVVEVVQGTGSVVLTGDGSLLLERVQIEGGETACAAEILRSISETLGI